MILPIASYILFTQGTSQLKILIFAAMLSLNPALEQGERGAWGMVLANLVGGGVSIVLYEFQTMVPSFTFLLLQFTLLCLVFGRQIFWGGKYAALCGSALGTVILLFGLGTMPIGDETGAQFDIRIVHLLIAAVYVAFAFKVVSYYTNWRIQRRARIQARRDARGAVA